MGRLGVTPSHLCCGDLLAAAIIMAAAVALSEWVAACGKLAGSFNSLPTAYFGTLPPRSTLPSDSNCAARVRHSPWEPRPDNYTANHTIGIAGVPVNGASTAWDVTYAPRINGSFTGTTDEILQWGACKWGLDENIQRARAVQESTWYQSQVGDYTMSATLCKSFGKSPPCYQSYGIFQVKASDFIGTYPASQQSTPFNVDYSLAWLRACFDGDMAWLGSKPASTRKYATGDIWGCVGAWYSGSWYDSNAQTYIKSVKQHLANKEWLR